MRRNPVGHPRIVYPMSGPPKILIAYGKAVLVQFEGLATAEGGREESNLDGIDLSELRERPELSGQDPADARRPTPRHARVEANEEGRPAVIEVLCDECETALNFADFEEDVRNEVLLTLGAR